MRSRNPILQKSNLFFFCFFEKHFLNCLAIHNFYKISWMPFEDCFFPGGSFIENNAGSAKCQNEGRKVTDLGHSWVTKALMFKWFLIRISQSAWLNYCYFWDLSTTCALPKWRDRCNQVRMIWDQIHEKNPTSATALWLIWQCVLQKVPGHGATLLTWVRITSRHKVVGT